MTTTNPETPEMPLVDAVENDVLSGDGMVTDDALDLAELGESATQPEAQSSESRDSSAEHAAALKAAEDKYLRLMAEFDNYKRRTAREHQRLIESANEALLGELIGVRENFQRAIKTRDTVSDPAQFIDGVSLIFAKFDEVLTRNGLEPFCEAGELFDPQLHDALMRMPSKEIEEGHIVDVYEKGYMLKKNVIRHARVVVSSGKPQADESVAAPETGA